MLWDLFCRVIDNYGDIGVCWRLASELVQRGHRVRLWVDDASALAWMAPGAREGHWDGLQVLDWARASQVDALRTLPRADVWVEAFGCEIPLPFVAWGAQHTARSGDAQPVWLNLEYLSAESYVERSHGLQSPVLHGPAKGWSKTFVYPGFSPRTAGLLRNTASGQAVAQPLDGPHRAQCLARYGVASDGARIVLLFCYEPPLLQTLLAAWAAADTPVRLLVSWGRSAQAVQALLGLQTSHGALQLHYLPPLSQTEFDTLLDCCDLNFVRGEDSLVRALWAGKPLVWHIYPQHDWAHGPKLEAFLDMLQCDPAVRALHRAWNAADLDDSAALALQVLQPEYAARWQAQMQATRQRLLELPELTSQLILFAQKNR